MSLTDPYTDVVELCALLQCLGFSVKSLDTTDGNASQDGGLRTVVINCQSSGLHVVLENPGLSCSCPTSGQQQNSGIWQVSGVTGGKPHDKEFGCTLLGSLPRSHRDRLTKELHDIIRCIKAHNESDADILKDTHANKSASMIELKTPDKLKSTIKADTPTRYRSLDTLTATNKKVDDQPLPTPGLLQRANLIDASAANRTDITKQAMCSRQSTYTLSSTPGSGRRRNKTSSPIKASSQKFVLDSIIAAEKAVGDAQRKLANVIRELMDDDDDDHNLSISSFALDVSKISVLKVTEPAKPQFASSPNLANIEHMKEDLTKNTLKRLDSASTSHLAAKKENSISKLRRLSPSLFKSKIETSSSKTDKAKTSDVRSRVSSLLKPKIVTPVRTPKVNRESTSSLSGSTKKKFSHVKSTIPRPSKKE